MSMEQEALQARWAEHLRSDSIEDRVSALRQISSRDSVRGLTIDIVVLSGSDDDDVRMWASEALESAVQPDPSELLRLIHLLESTRDSEICYWAATMLGRLGREAAASARVLDRCVRKSMYLPARERAVWALSQIGPAAEIAIPTLTEAAQTGPARLQRLATETLRRVNEASGRQTAGRATAGRQTPGRPTSNSAEEAA
jgi:hypothetical protein